MQLAEENAVAGGEAKVGFMGAAGWTLNKHCS